MTGLTATISGVDYAATRIRDNSNGATGIPGLSAAADGSMASGGIVIQDPNGDFVVQGWEPVEVEDDRCVDAPRLFTGYTGDQTYRRGRYRDGPGGEVDITLLDSNVLLQMHRINGNDSLRPAETDSQRLAWLLGTEYIPLVSDLGLVNGVGRMFDATQYKGQFPSDVLADLCGPRGQIFFVYWDQDARGLGLFFDAPGATTFTSAVSISNDLSDCDDINDPAATVFYPYQGAESLVDPSEVYSSIRYVYKGGAVYRTNATTASNFFPAPIGHRDTLVENDRVGLQSTAITFADRILQRDAVQAQSVDLTVMLPATKVGLIQPGHRIRVRLTHVPGFRTFAYTRVETLTITQTEGTRDYYDVTLHLSTHGREGGGGTGPVSGTDPFPHQPSGVCANPSFLGTGLTVTADQAPAGTSFTASNPSRILDGTNAFSSIPSGVGGPLSVRGFWNMDFGAPVTVQQAAIWINAPSWPDQPLSLEASSNNTTWTEIVSRAEFESHAGTPDPDHSTVVLALPAVYRYWRLVYSLTMAAGPAFYFGVDVIELELNGCTADEIEADPPASGMPVTGETPTPAPDGVETVFHTLNPYATNSLHVSMNGIELVRGVDFFESDPSCGEFRFAQPPRVDAEILVWYIGE